MIPDDMAALMARAMPDTRTWSEAEFSELAARSGAIVAGESDAFVIGQVVAGEAEIFMVLTEPKQRRQGLARSAMQAFHDTAARAGADRVILDVAADNLAARALYDSLGYTQIAERMAYYQRSENASVSALMLEKRL